MPEQTPPVDNVVLYMQVGTETITLGVMAYQRIRAMLSADESKDPAELARIDREYADRIARAQANGASAE